MRALRFVFVGSLAVAAAACGLDVNGLAGDDDGGVPLTEAGAPVDGTLGNGDASGIVDGTSTSDTGPTGEDSGDDVGTTEDSGRDDAADSAANAADASDAGDATGEDAADAAADGDAALDAADASDAADAADACSSIEICNNGIDDNCNGLIDCADPECTPGWTCTAGAVPNGWTIVEYVETSRPACSPGYGTSFDVVEGPDGGPASCTCACNVTTPGSCTDGNFTVTSNELSIGCGGIPITDPASGGACEPATVTYSPKGGAEMQVTPVGYTPGSCTPAPSQTEPPVTYAGQGRLCKDTDGSGAGCPNNGACAPTATGNGFSLCIDTPGIESCPPGFANPPHLVGNGVNDTRGCTACTCGTADAGPCVNPTLTLFTDTDCADGGESVPADDTCTAFPGPVGGILQSGPTYVAYEYTAQVQGEACPPSPVSPDGGVSLKGTRTVCCQ